MILRRYPEAAALFDRAGRQSPNAAAVLAMADLLRKTKRSEDLEISLAEPAGPLKRLFQLFASGKLDSKSFSALFTRRLAAGIAKQKDADLIALLDSGFGPARKQLRDKDIPIETALDVGLAAFTENVTGDDATGYRVRLFNSTGDGPKALQAFVVREDGQYRILDFNNGLGNLGAEALRRLDQGDPRAARQWLDWAREAMAAGSRGDDPLAAPPFVALWAPGSGDGSNHGSDTGVETLRCAAATLLTEGSLAAQALPLLTSCREAAADGAQKVTLDLAIAHADRDLGRWPDLALAAERLLAAAPASQHAYDLAIRAALGRERWDEARRLAEERLARLPNDHDALQTLAGVEQTSGDYDGEEAVLTELVESGRADANDFNNLAWLALVRGRVDDKAIARAQRAATLSEYTSHMALHTLASLYAEQGRAAEAYRVILQALGTRPDESPSSVDWYVFGRLAETYGLTDAARRYYERVAAGPPKPDPASTYQLARKRLEVLGAAKPARAHRS
jgi:tetratricopeptide (TPR) repeat protein